MNGYSFPGTLHEEFPGERLIQRMSKSKTNPSVDLKKRNRAVSMNKRKNIFGRDL
jgi:hypothetical protein